MPDEVYFRNLVAKAILFRITGKIVSAEKFGGYRANIVTYTIAFLSHLTAQRVDLESIWRAQRLSAALSEVIQELCRLVHPLLVNPPGGRNITEWSKLEKCWDLVREGVSYQIENDLQKELLATDRARRPLKRGGVEIVTRADETNIARVSSVDAARWFEIARWAKQTRNLESWQRSVAFSLGRIVGKGNNLTRRQALQAVRILDEVERLGLTLSGRVD